MLQIPAFGETDVIKTDINERTCVYSFSHGGKDSFGAYCALLEQNEYICRERREADGRYYAAYQKENRGIFVTSFEGSDELRIVTEEECLYFTFADTAGEARVEPQITQIALEDFGMSYVIRLSDGRFIVIDGGRNFEPDQDKLMNRLAESANGETPVIAAWIMTHPHDDHYHCFNGFMERYGDRVVIQRFLLNFPEADDFDHYPKLAKISGNVKNAEPFIHVPIMLAYMQSIGAPIYTPHTGQIYRIGDATLEILACMDDTIHLSQNINGSSVVIRMELGGQVILWATDASFEWAKLPARYGEYLKADILQIPHHGFQCGSAEEEIAGYQLIRPQICFLPVIDYNAYTVFCTYKKGTRYLMTCPDVEEIITGDVERTVTLPYTPNSHDVEDWRRRFRFGLDSAGSSVWIFTGLSTANAEDFVFTVLNTTNVSAHLSMDFYFEDPKATVRFVQAEIKHHSIKTLCIIGDEVDKDFGYYNPNALAKQGIPENVPFAVRFTSNLPIVVSHKEHKASYYSSTNV